jgi:hypothetical protein
MGKTTGKATKTYSLRLTGNALQNIDDIYKIKASEIVVLGIIHGSRRASNVRKLT